MWTWPGLCGLSLAAPVVQAEDRMFFQRHVTMALVEKVFPGDGFGAS